MQSNEALLRLSDAVGDPRWPWATERFLADMVRTGQLTHARIRRTIWLRAEDLDAFAASRFVTAKASTAPPAS